MKLFLNKSQYFDSKQGIDISIPLKNGSNNVNAWYADPVEIKPVVNGEFIGDVNQGGPVNFKTVFLNPHGNGTHTECVGHISTEHFTINQCLKEHHFLGQVLTVEPTVQENKQEGVEDKVITKACLEKQLDGNFSGEVLAIRTLPNGHEKRVRSNIPIQTHHISQRTPCNSSMNWGWSISWWTCRLLIGRRMAERSCATEHFGITRKMFGNIKRLPN